MSEFGPEPASIVAVVQSLIIHGGALEHYGIRPAAFSRETLPVEMRLDQVMALDPRPLTTPRPPEARAVGTCRDYATLTCSALRHHGRAARVRCGFAAYLGGSPWEDHWVCEVWFDGRWRRIDAQLDTVLRTALAIPFPAEDVPPAMFLTGHQAWRACRGGSLAPDSMAHGDEAAGLWFVLVNLMRDHLALGDRITSPWDNWRSADPAAQVPADALLVAADALAEGDEIPPLLATPWWAGS